MKTFQSIDYNLIDCGNNQWSKEHFRELSYQVTDSRNNRLFETAQGVTPGMPLEFGDSGINIVMAQGPMPMNTM